MLRFLILIPFVVSLSACGSAASEKGDETPMPAADGKSDTWWAPTLHGELRWSEEDRGDFDGIKKFHAWDFSLGAGSEGSKVTLTTGPIDANVDTVAYLYRWSAETRSWGAYIARNDDHGGSIGSQLRESLDGGEYRLVVKGYKDKVRGTFSLMGTCAGAGCPILGPANGLSPEQEDALVKGIDDLCGDTFCAGDFNWWVASVDCVWGTGCTVVLDAKSYYAEDAFPAGWLEHFTSDQLTATGTTSDGAGPYLVTVEKLVDRASEGLWARSSCELAIPYTGFEDLLGEDLSGGWPTDTFSDQLMDCVSSIETILLVILPRLPAP